MNYRLYIGLDVQGGKPWNRQDAINIIVSLCKEYGIGALSISDCQGIYTYNNGKTVQEKALKQECIMIEIIFNTFIFK